MSRIYVVWGLRERHSKALISDKFIYMICDRFTCLYFGEFRIFSSNEHKETSDLFVHSFGWFSLVLKRGFQNGLIFGPGFRRQAGISRQGGRQNGGGAYLLFSKFSPKAS